MLKLSTFFLFGSFTLLAATTAERSDKISKAGEDLSNAMNRDIVLRNFPKDLAEFKEQCQGETGDCSELFERMMPEIMKFPEHVKPTIEALVPLLPVVAFDADAPSYLQHQANEACQKDPKGFNEALAKLKKPEQDKAIRFLNANMVKKNVPWFLDCLKAAKKANLPALAKRLEKVKR